MAEEWLTTAQAAEFSGYHPEHLRKLIRKGELLARKFGPVWAISRSSLETYIELAEAKGDKRWGPKED